MADVPDQQDMPTSAIPGFHFCVDLGDQRADGIHHPQVQRLCGLAHRSRAAMGGKDGDGALGDLFDLLHEDCALPFRLFDHGAVVNDSPPDIDRGAVALQCLLDRVDGAFHARTEPARIGQQNLPVPCLFRTL